MVHCGGTRSEIMRCLMQILIYADSNIFTGCGRCLFKYLAYESGLGIKSAGYSPCRQFLAVGSYDQAVRTLNHLTWKTFAEFTHAASVPSPCNAAMFKVNLSISIINHHFADLQFYSAYLHSY
jgi:hypothetical protein